MSDSDLTINCWVLGDHYEHAFPVEISGHKYVGHLKDAIKAKKQVLLKDIDAGTLILYKVSIQCTPQLAAHATALDLNQLRLNPLLDLSQVFADGLLHQHVHVAVEIPSAAAPQMPDHEFLVYECSLQSLIILILAEPLSKKRKLDYDASKFKDVNISPSKFSKPVNFRDAMTQGGGREIYIQNRPINFDSVPLTLISPIFGRLSDDLFTKHEDFLSQDFEPARNLAIMLSRLEQNEASRKESFLGWLLELLPGIEREESSHDTSLRPHEEFRARLATPIIKGQSRDSRYDYETDSHVELENNLLLVVEVKPELGEESSDPHWQAMAYFRTYYMQERCKDRAGHSPLPAILITLYGPCIDISAAIVCPDGTVQVEALTPGLRVDCDHRDDRQRNLLAGFVRALRNAFEGLKSFYESLAGPIPNPCGYPSNRNASIDRPFPYKDSYSSNERRINFKYLLRMMQGALIFLAEHTEPEANAKRIVVKFTRTYSEDVHELLADAGFAPELFAMEDLAGGWKMVVMEYLSGWEMLERKSYDERLQYRDELRNALGIIHGADFVHGDVRGPNILVSGAHIKLIDFDHCGKDEVMKYPQEWDHSLRPADAKEGDLMRKRHDSWMFDRIFDNPPSSSGRRLYP